jgi:predicted aspartyl protease
MNQYQACKQNYFPITRKLISDVDVIGISSTVPGQRITAHSLWDTGAEWSLISPNIANAIGLVPIGNIQLAGINSVNLVKIAYVTAILPNDIRIPKIKILISNLIPNIDMLIGMDIIARGDLSISNGGNGTVFSFVMPSFPDKIDLFEKAVVVNKGNKP